MESKKVVVLKKEVVKFKGGSSSTKYSLNLVVNQFLTLTIQIDESKYVLALMQKEKNPLTTNELRLNVPVEFYTGVGNNERPYYMALVPYATYVDKDGKTHARKQSLFFSSTQMQIATSSKEGSIEFEEKELASISEDEELYTPEEDK
ncbi:MAG: hypothetical protein K6E87_04455 [bacterium]|nr:hypothetical protein [bacterium]